MCHCKSCRALGGGAGQLVTLYPEDAVSIEGELTTFCKPGSKMGPDGTNFSHRKVCSVCKGNVCNAHPGLQLVDVCGGLFGDDPVEKAEFRRVRGGVNEHEPFDFDIHINYAETIVPVHDGKPKFKDTPSDLGGSGEMIDEATYAVRPDPPTEMTDETEVHGACYCGAVTVVAKGTPMAKAICHCSYCRAWSGGIGQLVNLYQKDNCVITGELDTYAKPGSRLCSGGTNFSHRKSCKVCGGCVLNEHPGIGKYDICGGILDYGGKPFEYTEHVHYESTIFPMVDGLVKWADFPTRFGGTGNILDDAGNPKETPMDPTQAIADYIEKEKKTQLLRDEAQKADPNFT